MLFEQIFDLCVQKKGFQLLYEKDASEPTPGAADPMLFSVRPKPAMRHRMACFVYKWLKTRALTGEPTPLEWQARQK